MIDFGIKFGLVSKKNQNPKNIIILNHRDEQFGIVIDGVTEVITTNRSLLKMPDQSNDASNWFSCSSGLIKVDENILVVLDLEKLLTHHETSLDDRQRGE
jgi:chemotaxis signal transduction protein